MANILVIDDEPGVRISLQAMLEEEGHNVMLAEHVNKALQIITENSGNISLIITDIMMPEMDGIQFITQLLKSKSVVPVLAISGGGTALSSGDALAIASGIANATLRKPFGADELNTLVTALLAKGKK